MGRRAVVGPHPLSKSIRQSAGALDPAAAAHWEVVTGTKYTGYSAGSQTQHQGTDTHRFNTASHSQTDRTSSSVCLVYSVYNTYTLNMYCMFSSAKSSNL